MNDTYKETPTLCLRQFAALSLTSQSYAIIIIMYHCHIN